MRTARQTARWFGTAVEDVAFGHVLGRVRRAAGLTQARLAELVPMEKSRIVRFETGRQHARIADVLAIEGALLQVGAIPTDGHLLGLTRNAIPILDELLAAKAGERSAA